MPVGADVAVLVWLNLAVNIAVVLPTVVVPVLMMILFKPIGSAVKGLLTCRRCRALAHGKDSTGRTAESKEVPSTTSSGVKTGL